MRLQLANLVETRTMPTRSSPTTLSTAQASPPRLHPMTRWFEDIAIDEPFPLGSHTFTEAEIIAFSAAYDPQPVHLDPVGCPCSRMVA